MAKRATIPAAEYLVALSAVAAAALINVSLLPWTRTSLPLYLIAVMIAARAGGLWPSLFAAVASLILQDLIRTVDVIGPSERVIRALLFLSTAAFVSSLVKAQRRAEANERGRRVWYEGMLTSVGDAVLAADRGGRLSFLNAAAEALTGWPAAEAIGRPIAEVIPIEVPAGEHPASAALRLDANVPTGRAASFLDRAGRRRPIDGHAASVRTPNGEPAGVVVVLRDASARRRAEEAASELAAIVASSHDAIVCRGPDDRITSWNPGAERLFGYAAAEAIGRPISILLPPDRTDEMPRMLTRIEGGAAVSHYETERIDKNGRRLDVSVSVSPLRDGEGRVVGMATIARDVTERRQSERRLAAQYAVGRILSESATVAQSLPRLLEALGTSLRWDAALCWRFDRASGVLRCAADWHRGTPATGRIVESSRALAFAEGDPLPGRVWAARELIWVEDMADDPHFVRASAADDRPRCVAAFPIVQGDDVLGVVELLGTESRPVDDDLIGLFRLIGTQIGLFIERRRAEDELRVAEARFRRLAESGILCIMIADIEAHLIVDANDAFLDLVGATRADLAAGRIDWQAITPPEYREVDARAVAQLIEAGVCEPFVKEYVGLHGRRVSVLLGAARLDAESSRCIVFLIDITERRRTEDALQHREEQLRLALDVARMGTWDWNLTNGSLEWSDDLEEIFGLPHGGFGGTFEAFAELVHADDRALVGESLDRALGGDDEYEIEFRVVSASSGTLWINARGRVFRDASGQPIRLVGLALDITGRKRAEQELQAAKEAADAANLAKDEFLAVLSHELRTPLTPVLASVSAMLDDPATPEDYRSILQMIRRNVDLEARLIDDLLDVTRISRGKLALDTRAVDAHELLYQALEICVTDLRDKGLHLQIAFDAGAHHVEADPARLQQVYWNLIKNAVKFTPTDGVLTLRTRNAKDGRLIVEVADTGMGIEPEMLPKIFNAFEQGDTSITRRFGGLGLGLAISRSVIELLGGTLTASSAGRDRGSSFRIEMASVAPPAESGSDGTRRDGGTADTPSEHGRLRILLVEDSEDALRVLARLLRLRGHEVVTAASVGSASEVMASAAGPVDLLISDLGLPDGTGLDVIRRVREHADCPAIALSGFGTESDIQRSLEAGFAAHLVKPIEFSQLEATIGQIVASTAEAREATAR